MNSDPQIPSSSPARTDTPPDTEPAEVLAADEVADYEQLRALVSPAKSLELLDDFAKWLFVTAAIVGTLGASFGVAQADDLTGSGKRMFSWAVALVGGSLALAAFARLPLPRRVNRYSDVSLRAYIAPIYRLPLLVLDATGMRVGELEALTWGDVDEPRGRWRVSQAVAKTGRARWVQVPEELFEAVTALVAREDRTPERPVFQGVTADRLRTAIARACTAAGVPAFSPHDLRHRRISLEHLRGVPWARIGELVGQRNLAVTANTYTHVLSDEAELDYDVLVRRTPRCTTGAQKTAISRDVQAPYGPSRRAWLGGFGLATRARSERSACLSGR